MKLEVSDLFTLQAELDNRIFELHNLSRAETTTRRILALLVELGECANTTRTFKFWSLQDPAEKAIILEEYGDGLHFLLSLALDLNYQPDYFISAPPAADLSSAFLLTYQLITNFALEFTLENYEKVMASYLAIGVLLHFSSAEIREYYLLKNVKNHQRQDEGY